MKRHDLWFLLIAAMSFVVSVSFGIYMGATHDYVLILAWYPIASMPCEPAMQTLRSTDGRRFANACWPAERERSRSPVCLVTVWASVATGCANAVSTASRRNPVLKTDVNMHTKCRPPAFNLTLNKGSLNKAIK